LKRNSIPTDHAQIVLTELRESDLERLALLINDPVVYKNTLSIPYPYNLSNAQQYFEHVSKFESLNGYQKDWIIRKDGDLIGGIGLLYNHGFDTHNSEFGYWLATDFRGQGIMTICMSAFIEFVFSTTKIIRIEAHVFESNAASCRVLEKCGFSKEGYLRKLFEKDGEYLDAHLYAIIR
jgi:RimJ/RimL family protein N-acetyltransferase